MSTRSTQTFLIDLLVAQDNAPVVIWVSRAPLAYSSAIQFHTIVWVN